MKIDGCGYLIVYFTGVSNDGEQVYFSISKDGLHWNDLNGGRPVLKSSVGEKGVRDPFIIRTVDEYKYFIIATDLRIASGKGWDRAQYEGSRSIVIWESHDLVNWSQERIIEVGVPKAGCVWAPEAIYNDKTDEYMVFWASMVKEEGDDVPKQRIYCSNTKDFRTFSNPIKYIERENHIIDTTIIKDKEAYYRISKDETTKIIKMDTCLDLLKGPFIPVNTPVLEDIIGVEGPAAFQLNNKEWCLMVDQFAIAGGYRPLVTRDISSGEFQVIPSSDYDMGSNKKSHGSILKLNQKEYELIMRRYGNDT